VAGAAFFRPKGAKYASPGQRPGNRCCASSAGLKGRKNEHTVAGYFALSDVTVIFKGVGRDDASSFQWFMGILLGSRGSNGFHYGFLFSVAWEE